MKVLCIYDNWMINEYYPGPYPIKGQSYDLEAYNDDGCFLLKGFDTLVYDKGRSERVAFDPRAFTIDGINNGNRAPKSINSTNSNGKVLKPKELPPVIIGIPGT